MHFRGLDLNLLVVLNALLEEQSVTGAARRLNITQPAVSSALKKLRSYADDPLFESIGRGLKPTPRAREMAGPVKEILLQIGATFAQQDGFKPAEAKRTFSVGLSTYTAQVIGPRLIERLSQAGDQLTCYMQEIGPESLSRMRTSSLDLCIALSDWHLNDPVETATDFRSEALYCDKFVLVGPSDPNILPDDLSYDDFCELPYLATHFREMSSLPEKALNRMPRRPRARAAVQNSEVAISVVARTKMVTMVQSLLAGIGDRPGLKVLPAPFPVPPLEEAMIWHRRNDVEPGNVWLREQIKAIADDLIAAHGLERTPRSTA